MFQSTPKHSLSEIWKRLPLSQINSIPLKGEVSNRSLFLMNPQELELDYPWADTLPEERAALEIAPGGQRPLKGITAYYGALAAPCGSAMKKLAPDCSTDSAHTLPPCRAATPLTIASPSPLPEKSAEECRRWNAENNLSP